jgi:3,4-dihydroxy 2-butanone 4-phosphate synthase/GTP cyclohydrolase II
MARLPDLVSFAQHHNLKLGTIADLIAYRRRTEILVDRTEEGILKHGSLGDWRVISYRNRIDHTEDLAIIKGDISGPDPVLVRMHAPDLITDVMGGTALPVLQGAMRIIDREGRGVVVLLRETHPTALAERIRTLAKAAGPVLPLRDYGIGAQILLDLGVRDMILLSNTQRTIVGWEGYGLNIVEQRPIASGAEHAD